MEKEIDNKINFLDLSIEKTHNNLQLGFYRKPAATDSIIHNNSCHPYEHNRAAINVLFNPDIKLDNTTRIPTGLQAF
jgi:hypothetical protein